MYARTAIPAALLADVKNYLNITWDDLATDERIRGLIDGLAEQVRRMKEEQP